MHYLFGFSGRINRAKMWLFILVTLAWEAVAGFAAVIGLRSMHMVESTARWSTMGPDGGTSMGAMMRFPHLGPIDGPAGWATVGVLAVLGLAWFVSMLAVTTKRLHDRNKGAIWVIPFVLIPWGVHIVVLAGAVAILEFGQAMIPFGIGFGLARLVAGVLSIWAFLELFCFRGTAGANQYGPDPLA